MSKALRGVPTALVGALLAAVLLLGYTTQNAEADHQPADKVAIAGSETQVFGPSDGAVPILQETMKVSSPSDLIFSVTLECSIVTALKLGNDDDGVTDMDSAEGKIDVWIEIDGKRVPVSSDDSEADEGQVTFCNTEHQQRLTDSEDNDPADGIDTFEDYLRTKNANGFNWLAFNTGSTYDGPANGNNILDIVVYAELVDTTAGTEVCELGSESCSEAIIGHRTLVVEPTKTANHETAGSGVEEASAQGSAGGNGKN